MVVVSRRCALLSYFVHAVWSQDHATVTFSQNPVFNNSQLKISCCFSRYALLTAVTIYAFSRTGQEGSLHCSIQEGSTVGTGVFLGSSYEGCPTFDPLSGHVNITLEASPRLALEYSCLVSLLDHETFYQIMSNITRLEVTDAPSIQDSPRIFDTHFNSSILSSIGFKNTTFLTTLVHEYQYMIITTEMPIALSASALCVSVIIILFSVVAFFRPDLFQKRRLAATLKDTDTEIGNAEAPASETGEAAGGKKDGSWCTNQQRNIRRFTPQNELSPNYEQLRTETNKDHTYAVLNNGRPVCALNESNNV